MLRFEREGLDDYSAEGRLQNIERPLRSHYRGAEQPHKRTQGTNGLSPTDNSLAAGNHRKIHSRLSFYKQNIDKIECRSFVFLRLGGLTPKV